jgi:hypothetical protein
VKASTSNVALSAVAAGPIGFLRSLAGLDPSN